MRNDSVKKDGLLFLPSRFKVDNCHLAGLSSTHAKVFVADVTAFAWNGEQRVFKQVFFVESFGECAWIAGCDTDTRSERPPREAPIQRELLNFLRDINLQEREQFGTVLTPQTARQSSQARVTEAYVTARGLQHDLRIGYCDSDGMFRVAVLMVDTPPVPPRSDSTQRDAAQI